MFFICRDSDDDFRYRFVNFEPSIEFLLCRDEHLLSLLETGKGLIYLVKFI